MAAYVGHRGGRIVFVSTELIEGNDLEVVPLPKSMKSLDSARIVREYRVRDEVLVPIGLPSSGLRLAVVGVYDVPCGIATYTRNLVQALRGLVDDVRVFAEHEKAEEDPNVVRCWRRGQQTKDLVATLYEYAPDLILIQHEYGNFPVARHWLSLMSALAEYRTLVTLHSVYAHPDKTIVEAACPEIVVHTDGARRMLKDTKRIGGNVSVVPHGCPPVSNQSRLWNLYSSDHTVIQFGFGFAYKGWENSIQVIALLKEQYPDVFFTGLMSERWPGVHAEHAATLRRLTQKLGVEENVGLVLGFQSDPVLDSYLRTNRVALFPYREQGEHTVYGCSGAAREAMAKGLPVVVSTVPLFEDLEGVVPRHNTVDGWVSAVAEAFENGGNVAGQNVFLAENSWSIVARKYLDIVM